LARNRLPLSRVALPRPPGLFPTQRRHSTSLARLSAFQRLGKSRASRAKLLTCWEGSARAEHTQPHAMTEGQRREGIAAANTKGDADTARPAYLLVGLRRRTPLGELGLGNSGRTRACQMVQSVAVTGLFEPSGDPARARYSDPYERILRSLPTVRPRG